MVKRVVDTDFWTSRQVLDMYSVEDKYFALYLMTNDKSSQVGIYSLPKKIMSFETGFTTEVLQVLIDRFSNEYGQIIYSEKTQEVTVLRSLSYSILKGGKPVSDLLRRELREVEDGNLILETHKAMIEFWQSSIRKYDQTIQAIFEEELITRELMVLHNENQNVNMNQNDNFNDNNKKNDNDNDNEESSGTNRGTNRGKLVNSEEEHQVLERYINYLKHKNPNSNQVINSENILCIFYQELLGEVTLEVKEKFKEWEEKLAKSIILEALIRSVDKYNPLPYASKIIDNWVKHGVRNSQDIVRLDRKYIRE